MQVIVDDATREHGQFLILDRFDPGPSVLNPDTVQMHYHYVDYDAVFKRGQKMRRIAYDE